MHVLLLLTCLGELEAKDVHVVDTAPSAIDADNDGFSSDANCYGATKNAGSARLMTGGPDS